MNPRQAKFVEEYLVDLNATQAAVRAGYSAKTAKQIGSRLLTVVDVSTAIANRQQALGDATGLTQERIRQELAIVGFSNIWHYEIDDDGHVSLAAGAPDSAIRAVSSIKRKRRIIPNGEDSSIIEVETEIKLWDKPATLRLAGQHLGMYIEKKEISVPAGAGVLAVPVPIDAEQWGALAAAQQAVLVAKPGSST
jgi:phage terminase small subunit